MSTIERDSGASLKIPSVTVEDLHHFRSRHFHDISNLTTFNSSPNEPAWDASEEDHELGYYADGVRRTITDEQVAMFRHSEIQALLRERRQRQQLDEFSSARSDEQEDKTPDESPSRSKTLKRVAPESPGDVSHEHTRPTKRKRRKGLRKPSPDPGEEVTYRRLARELDERTDVAVELDY
ncbi:hypothetical protein H2199_001441 [Coniosporium tulheliwenetii]|uniref:Uncharacterized protein n=1 Tax=Coniosporium tulheliwenetii TaxID=3383036 RepID=A0ACC2ZMJ1_9PEZI|nr:hypothetical protein H2199_001441 [Cladosporium sp. JES 115]